MNLMPKRSIKYYQCLACHRKYLTKQGLACHKGRDGCARKYPYQSTPTTTTTTTTKTSNQQPLNPNSDNHRQPQSLSDEVEVEYVGTILAQHNRISPHIPPSSSSKTRADEEDYVEIIKVIRVRRREVSPEVPLPTTPTPLHHTPTTTFQQNGQGKVGGFGLSSAQPTSTTTPAAFFSQQRYRTAPPIVPHPPIIIGQRSESNKISGDLSGNNPNESSTQQAIVTQPFRYTKPPPIRRYRGKIWKNIVKANREYMKGQIETSTPRREVSPVVTPSREVSPVVTRSRTVSVVFTPCRKMPIVVTRSREVSPVVKRSRKRKVSPVVTRSPVRTRSSTTATRDKILEPEKVLRGKRGRWEGIHKCEICGRGLRSSSSKKRHLVQLHKEEIEGPPWSQTVRDSPFQCPLCPKVCPHKLGLQQHTTTIHKTSWVTLRTLINKKTKQPPKVLAHPKRAGGSGNPIKENMAGGCWKKGSSEGVSKSPRKERKRRGPGGRDDRPKVPLDPTSPNSSRSSSSSSLTDSDDDQSSLFSMIQVPRRGRPRLDLDQLKTNYDIIPGLKRSKGKPLESSKDGRSNPPHHSKFEQFGCSVPRCGRVFRVKTHAIRHTKKDHP